MTMSRRLRVVVVDDEPAARHRLVVIAAELGADVVAEAANGLEAIAAVTTHGPDVVLLDVEMPEVDGLDVARRLTEPRPFIVFATAYDQYAAAAFETEALDFVVKPVSRERLASSFERARRRLAEAAVPSPLGADVVAAVAAALGRDVKVSVPRRVLVRHLNGHRLVPVGDIDRFFASDNVVYAVVAAAESVVDNTLDELERKLAGVFVRISRGELVAIDRIERFLSNGDGSATVVTRDGQQRRVSRRRAPAVKETLAS
jgi:DNA-binding LytR/AlgR family response regulator